MLQESDLGVCNPKTPYFIGGDVIWDIFFSDFSCFMQFLNGKYFDSSEVLITLLLISGACCFH